METDRRRVLTSISGVGLTWIAGCSGDRSNGDSGDEDTPADSTPTSEDESEENDNQHDIDESFRVGSGAQSIRYIVEGGSLATEIGASSINTEADGVFIIVILNMENVGDQSIDITSRHLRVVDSQGREFDADTGANIYIEQDSRFDVDGITFEQLQPGLQQTRAVVFDVGPNESYALKVDPAGMFSGANIHYVALGNVPEP